MNTQIGKRTGNWARYVLALVAMVAAAGLLVAGGATEAKADATANGTFQFSLSTYNVVEGQQAVLTVTRTGATAGLVGVHYTMAAGSAQAGDWSSGTGYVMFNFNESSLQLLIPTTHDLDPESSETFIVTLDTSFWTGPGYSSGGIGATNVATVTILDNDAAATYSYGAATYAPAEAAGTFNVPVLRNGSAVGAASVTCTATPGTALTPGDFTLTTALASFVDGQTTANCVVTIVNDFITENPSEIFTMGFTGATGFAGGAGANPTTTVTIVDDDSPTVQWAATNFNVTEGNSGTSTATISATRTGDATAGTTVNWATSDGSATTADSDYVAGSGTFTWAPGDSTPKTGTVTITGDGTPESDQTVNLSFTTVPTAGTVGTPATATITILNDDSVSSLSFSATNYDVTEASTTVTVTVNRSGTTTGTVGVTYATSDGTALAGSDYTTTSGTLTWLTGETTKTFAVTILNDAVAEPTQSLNLTLSLPTGGATIATPSATITIFDDEAGVPTITSLSPTSGPIGGGNTVVITGANFAGTSLVTFGGVTASIASFSASTITVTAPAAPGSFAQTVNVVVTTPVGTSSVAGFADDYTYTGGPTVSSVSPNTGPTSGLTFVVITGTGFTPTGMTVTFGGTSATFSYNSATSLTAVSPAHSAGTFDVIVTTPGGVSPNTSADDFTYTGTSAPVITSITPTSGPVGTVVTVSGTGFTGTTLVTVGGVSGSFTFGTDSSLTVTVPSSTPSGTVDIRVTNAGGTSANVTADNFTNTTTSGVTTTYTLYFRWTLIAWTGIDNLNVNNAVRGIETGTANPNTNDVSGQLLTIWYWDASTQTYKGYFVGFENVPGANDFTTMRRGVSYWVAVLSSTTSWTVLLGQ